MVDRGLQQGGGPWKRGRLVCCRSTVAEKYKFVCAGRFLSYGQISLLRSDFSYTLADFTPIYTVRFHSYAGRFLSYIYGQISLLRWPISLLRLPISLQRSDFSPTLADFSPTLVHLSPTLVHFSPTLAHFSSAAIFLVYFVDISSPVTVRNRRSRGEILPQKRNG